MRQWYQWHWSHQRPNFAADVAWEQTLQHLLGAPWPCSHSGQLEAVLADVEALLHARGWAFGHDTYAWYADADRSLCRAAWCATVHSCPEVVIETAVAHGVTSRVVLEALARNGTGPPLAAPVGHVGLFIHDSLHTAENTLSEREQPASVMAPGGIILVDDIDSHMGFATFAAHHPEYHTIVCPSSDRTGLFGIPAHIPSPDRQSQASSL